MANSNEGAQEPVPSSSSTPIESMTSTPRMITSGFSAATQMLIDRARGVGASSSSASSGGSAVAANYEEMKRRVMESMKTTASMDLPPTEGPAKRNSGVKFLESAPKKEGSSGDGTPKRTPGRKASNPNSTSATSKSEHKKRGGKKGKKRKRFDEDISDSVSESDSMSLLGEDSDVSDASERMVDLPAVTQSGRKIIRPSHFSSGSDLSASKRRAIRKLSAKNVDQALCKRCGRGHSPENNMIVFCSGCNTPYHQSCHDPHISDEVVQDETKDWFCVECEEKRAKEESTRVPTPLPVVEVPDMIIDQEINWGHKSEDEKRAYLLSMSHARLAALFLHAKSLYPEIPLVLPAAIPTDSRSQNLISFQLNSTTGPILQAQTSNQASTTTQEKQSTQGSTQPRSLTKSKRTGRNGSASSTSSVASFTTSRSVPFVSASPPRINIAAHNSKPVDSSELSSSLSKNDSVSSSALSSVPSSRVATVVSAPRKSNPSKTSSRPPTLPIPKTKSPAKKEQTKHEKASSSLLATIQYVVGELKTAPTPQNNDDRDSRESTPASPPYPRAGTGLYSKLPPDSEDLDWLLDSNPDNAFSHKILKPSTRKATVQS